MSEHQTEDTLGALSQDSGSVDIVTNRNDHSTLTQSFSSANISDDYCNEGEQSVKPRRGQDGIHRNPSVVLERQSLNFPTPLLPTPNNYSPFASSLSFSSANIGDGYYNKGEQSGRTTNRGQDGIHTRHSDPSVVTKRHSLNFPTLRLQTPSNNSPFASNLLNSSANISDDYCSEGEQSGRTTDRWQDGIHTTRTNPSVVTERQPLDFPTPPLPIPNNYTPFESESEVQRRVQANQEQREMKSALRERILANAKTFDEATKLKQEKLRKLRLELVKNRERPDSAEPSSSSMMRKHSRCFIKDPSLPYLLLRLYEGIPNIRQATTLQQSGRLSPPPRTTPSQNPYSKNNSLKKTTKSRWE
jgi:hypothetical protein